MSEEQTADNADERYSEQQLRNFYMHRLQRAGYVVVEGIVNRAKIYLNSRDYLLPEDLRDIFQDFALEESFVQFCAASRAKHEKKLRAEHTSKPYHPAPVARASSVVVTDDAEIVYNTIRSRGFGQGRLGPDMVLSAKESKLILEEINKNRSEYKVYYQTLRRITVREIIQAIHEAAKRAYEGL